MESVAGPPWRTLPGHVRRRVVLRALLRSLLTGVAIVVAYFTLPMTAPFAVGDVAALTAGLAAVAALLTWQIHRILISEYPLARAVGALVVCVPMFVVVFATIYFVMSQTDPASWSEPLTRLDAAYFTITVFATVGFGDVTPVSQAARAVTTVQMLAGLTLVGVIARVVVGAVELRHRQNRED